LSESKRRLPLLGNGSIVSDYEPLFRYWEIARRRGREDIVEKSMLSRDDFRFIERLIEEERIILTRLLNILEDYYVLRVDPEIAREAYREVYGVELGGEDARRRIARILAGWLIEAAKQWGKIRLSGFRLPED